MNLKQTAAWLLITALMLPLTALGQGPQGPGHGPGRGEGPGGGPHGPGGGLMRLERLKEAGATDQQIKAVKELHFDAQAQEIDLRAKVEKAELALRQLMISEDASEAAVMKAADQVIEARAKVFKHELRTRLKAREILGAELIGQLRPLRSGDDRGPRRGPPGPDDGE